MARGAVWEPGSVPDVLVDPFQRRVKDLRISITDRCNFRCSYCMPEEGMAWLDRAELLTYEEQARIARVCVERYGFDAIRVTGGEPTLRAHVGRLFSMLAPLGTDLAMTTNGVRLPELAHDLAAAGLRRINVSLDSLRRDTFRELTRRDELDRVLAGIDAALDAGLQPVKITCVVMRGVNDDEVVDLAAFGRAKGVGVRFIEFMPLDADRSWTRDKVLPNAEIVRMIDEVYPLEAVGRERHGTASRYAFADGRGEIGLISPVTQPFCGDCNRIRLTAEGMLRTCLFSLNETDLRAPMRAGASDAELEAVIRDAVWRKELKHRIGDEGFIQPARSMSRIGG